MAEDTDTDTDTHTDTDTDPDETGVVTVFLRNDADVLLLCRSEEVGSYAGKWGAVAGHAEGDPDAAAREEIREETGLDPAAAATLVRRGDPFEVVDRDLETRWVVHPFLFDCSTRDIAPNYETAEFEWAPPIEILRRETVPDLWTSYDRVRPTAETLAADREHGSAYLSLRALETLRDEAALAVERGGSRADLRDVARDLVGARPTMTVVVTRIDRAMARASDTAMVEDSGRDPGTPAALEAAAIDGIDRALAADGEAAALAAERLPERVATLSRSGTVLDALERANPESVLVAESRPGGEGVDTAERLAAATDADVTLTTDAALAEVLVAESVEALVVGADSVLPGGHSGDGQHTAGRVLNKAGTRGAATVARREGIATYVVAASDKIRASADEDGSAGSEIDREERDPSEVYDGDADIGVANPTFDATPVERFDAVLTEHGALDAADVREVADEHRRLADWRR